MKLSIKYFNINFNVRWLQYSSWTCRLNNFNCCNLGKMIEIQPFNSNWEILCLPIRAELLLSKTDNNKKIRWCRPEPKVIWYSSSSYYCCYFYSSSCDNLNSLHVKIQYHSLLWFRVLFICSKKKKENLVKIKKESDHISCTDLHLKAQCATFQRALLASSGTKTCVCMLLVGESQWK